MLNEWVVTHSSWDWIDDSLMESSYILNEIEHNSQILLERSAYSWSQDVNKDFLIFLSRYINKSNETYYNAYIGLYMDFNVTNLSHLDDIVGYIDSLDMAYMYDQGSSTHYIGVKILNSVPDFGVHFPYPEYMPYEDCYYYMILSYLAAPGFMPDTAGSYSILLNAGPYIYLPQDTIEIVYGVAAGEGLDELISNTVRMQELFDSIALGIDEDHSSIKESDIHIFPNPTNGVFYINFNLTDKTDIKVKIFNVLGQLMMSEEYSYLSNGNALIKFDISDQNEGIYFVKILSDGFNYNKCLIIFK